MVDILPSGTQLCRALRYISEHHCHELRELNQVALRFDLSPKDQQFIVTHFCDAEQLSKLPKQAHV